MLIFSIVGLGSYNVLTPSPGLAQSAPTRLEPEPKGVRQQFLVAEKLYRNGQYGAALNAFGLLLSNYPHHTPSLILYAKTSYRLDRIQEAYMTFSRLDINTLDPETSYEFGLSFYAHQNWQGALYGFRRVPQDHPLHDLANYYGGVAALKMRQFELAESMIEKAIVLPDKLVASRNLHLRYLRKLRIDREGDHLKRQRQEEKDRLKKANAKKAPPTKSAPNKEMTPTEYEHKGWKGRDNGAFAIVDQKNQKIDFHGYALKNVSRTTQSAEFKLAPLFVLPFLERPQRKSVFVLQMNLKGEFVSSDGKEERILFFDNEDEYYRLYVVDERIRNQKNGQYTIAPWMEFPLPQDLWLSLGPEFSQNYPEFDSPGRSGRWSFFLNLGKNVEFYNLGTLLKYTYLMDADYKEVSSEVLAEFMTALKFDFGLTSEFKLAHRIFNYGEEAIDGPDSVTAISAEAFQELPLKFKIGSFGGTEYRANSVGYNKGSYENISADGLVWLGRLYLEAAPLPWIALSLSQLWSTTDWSQVMPQDAQESWELNTADYLEEFVWKIELKKTF
jgi:tetratricopeptide (TPR) repeat protein